jgi:hypothetical protein
MQVNNTLSASRFGAYFKKHLVDNYRLYFMSLIVLTGILLFALLIVLLSQTDIHRYSELLPFYLIGLHGAGFIFTSISFNELGGKPRGIDYLLLPASHLEKFLTTLLVTTVGFLVVYHTAFFLAVKAGESILLVRKGIHLVNDLSHTTEHDTWQLNYYFWFIGQAIILLGTLYFQKYSLIKTIFCVLLFLAGLYLLNAIFAQLFFHQYMRDWKEQFPFLGINIQLPQNMEARTADYTMHFVTLSLPKAVWEPLWGFCKFGFAPILWTVAYFKLRDKEI